MPIRQTLQQMRTALGNAYDSIEEQEGTVPTKETMVDLAASIDSIPAVKTIRPDLLALLGKLPDTLTITGDWENAQIVNTAGIRFSR